MLLAVSLAACSGAFDPVGPGSSSDDSSSDDSTDEPAPQVDAGPDQPALTAAQQWDQETKPAITAHGCYGCHANGAAFPNIGETYDEVMAFTGASGKLIGCNVAGSSLSTKGPHSAETAWWSADEKTKIDDFIAKAASENTSCKPSAAAARPYYDEDLGRLVE
jgi:hypothetical protein